MADLTTEHEQVEEPKPTGGQDNEQVAKMVHKLVQQANQATKGARGMWPQNYKFVVSGEQWSIRRPRWRFSEVVNITWSNIMTEVGIQTDARPQVDFAATEPSDFQFAEVLKEINNVNWEKPSNTGYGWQQKVRTAVFKSKIYDVVHAEVCWDQDLENGIGDVSLKILDPYGSFWDPIAQDLNEARWFCQADPVPVSVLKAEHPDKAEFIKADMRLFDGQQEPDSDPDSDRFFLFTETSKNQNTRRDRDTSRYGNEPMAVKIRCWLRDETTVETTETSDDGTEHILKKKYPRGRYIEVVGNTVLKDEENPYEDGQFPIARLVNYDYGEYLGENEVSHQRGPQKIVNYVWSYILDQMKMGANPQIILSGSAKKLAKKITNEPGLAVQVSNPNDIRKEPGLGIPAGMFNIMDQAIGLIDKVSGLQDVTRGAPQPGVTSGLMLEGFVEAAQTRPRLKNRSLDDFLTQIGYLMASRYLQYYSVPRVFRVTNKEGFPEFVEFFIDADEQGNKVANVRRMDRDGVDVNPEPMKVGVKGMPDVRATSGSNLPYARAQKTATALDLQGRGSITNLSMLKAINWPNPEEEDEKVKKEQEALAQMQPQGGQ